MFPPLLQDLETLSIPKSCPLLTRLLLLVEPQSQVETPAVNNTMSKEHAGTPSNGGYFNGSTSVQQPTAHHHQVAGYQWPAAQNTSSCVYYTHTSQLNHFMQIATPLPPNGLQVSCKQNNFYQDSRLINSNQPQSRLQKKKAKYLQQNVPTQWKSHGPNQWKMVPRPGMKDLQSCDTGMTAKPALPSPPSTNPPPYQQMVSMGQYESSRTHNNQVIYSHCFGENNTQQAMGYYHRPHSYSTQSQQPNRDGRSENMPVQQGTHVSYMAQRSQRHPAQRSPTFHSKGAVAQKSSWEVNQDVCSTPNNSSLYTGVQPGITTQPMPTTTSDPRQSSGFNLVEALAKYVPVISQTQDVAGSSQRTPYVLCNVLNVPTMDQNMSLGKELRNSRSIEAPPSATEEDDSGPTNTTKAIAVVQPLSQQSCQISSSCQAFYAVGDKRAAAASCESPQEVPEKPECAQELCSGLAGKMLVDQEDAQMSPLSDVAKSQSCESGEDPEASVSKSSHTRGPTATWTIKELQKLIETEETAQQSSDLLVDGRIELCKHFTKDLGSYEQRKDLAYVLVESKEFVNKHVKPDTELVQLKQGAEKLGVDALSTKPPPYRSTWLNTNDQLDDIDKEFGFPPCLRFPQKMVGQTDLATAASVTPEQADSDVSEKDAEDGDSPNPCYSFNIQVLPPEEAKLIYQQTESPGPHSEVARVESQDSDPPPEKDSYSSVGKNLSNLLSVAPLNETDCPIVCCLSELVENIFKSNPPSVKCKCGTKKSEDVVIDITDSDSDDSVIEMVDISSKSPCEVVILVEDQNDKPSSSDDASFHLKIDDVYPCAGSESHQSIASDARDGTIENPSDGEGERADLLSEGEGKELSDVSSDSSVETEEQTPVGTETAPLPDVGQTGQSEEESQPETHAVFPLSKESSWRKHCAKLKCQRSTGPEVSVDPPARKHSDSNSKAAQLVLFGSVLQGPGKNCERKTYFSSEGAVCPSSNPPEVLSVPLHSTKSHFGDPLPVQEQSVKNKLFEVWKKSFPVKSLKRKKKRMHRSSLSGRAQEKQPEKKLKLMNSSPRPSDSCQCRVGTKCTSPGKLWCSKWKILSKENRF